MSNRNIHRARISARALLNYADTISAIDAQRYASVAHVIRELAGDIFELLTDDKPLRVTLDMVGAHDE